MLYIMIQKQKKIKISFRVDLKYSKGYVLEVYVFLEKFSLLL